MYALRDELLGAVERVDEPEAFPSQSLFGRDALRFLGQNRDIRRELLQRGDDAVVRGAVGLSEWRVVFFGLDLGWAVVGFHDRLTGLGDDPSDVVYHFKKSYPAHAGELGQEVFSDSRIFALLECRPIVAVIDFPVFWGQQLEPHDVFAIADARMLGQTEAVVKLHVQLHRQHVAVFVRRFVRVLQAFRFVVQPRDRLRRELVEPLPLLARHVFAERRLYVGGNRLLGQGHARKRGTQAIQNRRLVERRKFQIRSGGAQPIEPPDELPDRVIERFRREPLA